MIATTAPVNPGSALNRFATAAILFVVVTVLIGLSIFVGTGAKAMPIDRRLTASCMGCVLGWLLVRRSGFFVVAPLLAFTACVVAFIGASVKDWDWFGHVTFLTAVALGTAIARYLPSRGRQTLLQSMVIIGATNVVWWCFIVANRNLLGHRDLALPGWAVILGGVAAAVVGCGLAIFTREGPLKWRYPYFFVFVLISNVVSFLVCISTPGFK